MGMTLLEMYIGFYLKCRLFLSDFNNNLIFLTNFLKIPKYEISRKCGRWKSSYSMRMDVEVEGQTNMTKLTVAFRKCANAPNIICGF